MTKDLIRFARVADYPAPRLTALETCIATGPKLFVDEVNLVARSFGATVPQGCLLAYLFRRFGYPNKGSDPYKELCTYLLTTAHPGMLMQITPYAGGDSTISIRFFVAPEAAQAIQAWETRYRDAHEHAFLDWIETCGEVPDWAETTIAEMSTVGMPQHIDSKDWRQVVPALAWIGWKAEREGRTDPRVAWLAAKRAAFTATHPDLPSGIAYRDPDPASWGEDDPLTPYARAVADTLAELRRPVWVRDVPIDPWGPVAEESLSAAMDEEAADPEGADIVAPVAGYPAGDLGNQDPAAFAELHEMILRLGGGDGARGIARATALLAPVAAGDARTTTSQEAH